MHRERLQGRDARGCREVRKLNDFCQANPQGRRREEEGGGRRRREEEAGLWHPHLQACLGMPWGGCKGRMPGDAER